MTLPTTPDAVDLAGRYAARACVRSFEANPMMWRDVGAMLVAALMAPDATATAILAMETAAQDEKAGE
jgi:hypothetical protein